MNKLSKRLRLFDGQMKLDSLFWRPTSLHDRGRDSDDDDYQDRDYDVAALANNLSQAFRYGIYENDDNDEGHGLLERDDEDVYFDDESAEIFCFSESLFTNSNWFAFEEEKAAHEQSTSTVASPSPNTEGTAKAIEGDDDKVTSIKNAKDLVDSATSEVLESKPGLDDTTIEKSTEDLTQSESDKPHDWIEWRESVEPKPSTEPSIKTSVVTSKPAKASQATTDSLSNGNLEANIVTDIGSDALSIKEWRERFMNYLEEQTDDEAMINSIQNDALERKMCGSEYGEQDRKAAILYEYETFKATEEEQLLDTYLRYLQVINDLKKCGYKKDNCELNYKFLNNLQPEWKHYGTLMRQTNNLMDINIDALYNILKQNQGDVNDAMRYKKKAIAVTSDPLVLVVEKTKVSKRKEKVIVQSESEGSDDEDISDLKKITALLAKAFNRKKYYAKPTNNNLRTSSASCSANKKPEYEGHFSKDCKKAKVKDYNYYKTKMLIAKKDSDEQVLLAKDQAWMESSSDSDQKINANMVFMAKMEKVLSDSEESSSSAEETIAEVSYYTSDFESESEYETSEYYDNSTNYGLFVNNDDDQEIFHDAIESASENFNENHIVSQTDHDQSEVDHNDSEDKDHLVDKLIKKFNHKIAKCQKRIEKANQQSKDLENQNKDLQDKYDVLKNQFEIQKSMGLSNFLMEEGYRYKVGSIEIKKYERGVVAEISTPGVGFLDPKYPQKVYKVVKALYGLHQAPRAWYATLSTFLLKNGYRRGTIDKTLFLKKDKHDIILVQVYVDDIIFGSTKKSWCDEFEALMKSRFQMSSMGELTFFLGLQVKQKPDGIFISQDKYVAEILKKFDFANVKTASTPIETQKPLVKDEEANDVDVHLYRSMIGSLMYLTASRPDIMFAVCACSRFQVTPKSSHLSAVKRIFRYLKGKPKLGLWYPRVSSFDLESYSDSDYAGANLDRKSTTGGCQFLGRRLISWQCKKQTIVATSTTEAEYVAAASCCGQVLWIQNQMLDYGFNFMNTKIYIDNESTICIVKNPVYHSKTKHIAIRHHFIRDAYEKKLIQVIFDAIQLMGSKSTSWDQIPTNIATAVICLTSNQKYNFSKLIFDDKQLANVSVPLDHFSVNTLTSKVFSFMVKKGKHFSGKVTSLFATMLVQPTQDEGASSERPSEAQPTPSPTLTSEVPHEPQTDSSPAHTSELPLEQQPDPSPSLHPFLLFLILSQKLLVGILEVTDQAKEIQHLKAQIKKLKQQAKPIIHHHRAWLKSVSLKQRLTRKSFPKKQKVHKEFVSKQDRKFAKGESSVQRDPLFDELPEDTVDHIETENAQDEGRTRDILDEDKEIEENVFSTEDVLSTDKDKVSTDKEKVSTNGSKVSTDRQIEGTDEQVEGTKEHNEGTEEHNEGTKEHIEGIEKQIESTNGQRKGTEDHTEGSATQATQHLFEISRDDKTIAKVLLNMSQDKAISREKEKGVELKDIEEADRPRPTFTRSLLTLKPLPKIDPEDKERRKLRGGMN
ncbi:putative ribonuclease H-like domain-containing protein [Tanacetum coccineum]